MIPSDTRRPTRVAGGTTLLAAVTLLAGCAEPPPEEHLVQAVEAILFVADAPLEIAALSRVLASSKSDIVKALGEERVRELLVAEHAPEDVERARVLACL